MLLCPLLLPSPLPKALDLDQPEAVDCLTPAAAELDRLSGKGEVSRFNRVFETLGY